MNEEKRKRLEELRLADAKRQQARESEAEDLELERLELVDKLEKEHGPQGRAFEVVDATDLGEGFFAVKLGPSVHYAKIKASKVTDADLHGFIAPNLVFPSVEQFAEVCGRRPIVRDRVGLALHGLYGDKATTLAKKA